MTTEENKRNMGPLLRRSSNNNAKGIFNKVSFHEIKKKKETSFKI
jgi:hypothetical protein